MIPMLLPSLYHDRLRLGRRERKLVLLINAATINSLLGDVKVAAAGGRHRRVGFHSATCREVPVRTFSDWKDPPPGSCEIDQTDNDRCCSRLDEAHPTRPRDGS